MTIVILFVIENQVERNISMAKIWQCIYEFALVIVPSIVGLFVFFKIKENGLFFISTQDSLKLANSVEVIGQNLLGIIRNYYKCFGYEGDVELFSLEGLFSIVSIATVSLVCIVIPILQLKNIKRESIQVKYFLIMAYAHNLVLIMFSVLTSNMQDYHLLTVIFVFVLLSCRYIYDNWLNQEITLKACLVLLFALAVIIESIHLLKASVGWLERYTRQRSFCDELVAEGLTKGYATFWNAYTNEVYSDGQLSMAGIRIDDNFVSSYYCLVDSNKYNSYADDSFILLSEEEAAQYRTTVDRILGEPIDSWVEESVPTYDQYTRSYNYQNIEVLVYDYDIAIKLNKGVLDGVLSPNECVFNCSGTYTNDYVILENGGVLRGPYGYIYPGDYMVSVIGTSVDNLTIDINSEQQPESIHSEVIDSNENCVVVHMTIDEPVDDFTIGLINETDQQIIFKETILEKEN